MRVELVWREFNVWRKCTFWSLPTSACFLEEHLFFPLETLLCSPLVRLVDKRPRYNCVSDVCLLCNRNSRKQKNKEMKENRTRNTEKGRRDFFFVRSQASPFLPHRSVSPCY